MRDFRDAKAMAHTLRAALAARGLKITVSESLELIATAFGAADWNTLSAMIGASAAREMSPPAPPSVQRPSPSGRMVFSADLEATLHRAVACANQRKHRYTTLEHLLLSLTDDADASAVMKACNVDLPALKKVLTRYVDIDLKSLVVDDGGYANPTTGFQRVIRQAVIHVQTSGRDEVSSANVLVAIFSETESHATEFLRQQGLRRFDALNFTMPGLARRGGDAAA
jgi:hypothetical protein